jgi:hypothetical protein
MTKRMLSVAAAAVLIAFTSLSVTMAAAEMNCRIPFRFIVHGKTLPPGTYAVTTNNSVVQLKGLQGSAFVLTNGLLSNKQTDHKLVFLKTGDRYDLIEIWNGYGTGREVVTPRKQLEERARAANLKIERIEIAAQ